MRWAALGILATGVLMAQSAGPGREPVRVGPGVDSLRVLVFVSTRCPISNEYVDRLKDLHGRYGPKVPFFFINSNVNEPEAETREWAKTVGISDLLIDKDAQLATALTAHFTPEAVLVDANNRIRYKGFIDDARNPARVKVHGLRDAIEAVLAGKEVQVAETRAFGCVIKKPRTGS